MNQLRRDKRVDTNETGITTTHYVAGGAFETATSQAGTVQRRLYVAGAAIVIDTVGEPTPAETRYLLKDHLGSLDVVLDSTGLVLERLSFDAWGKRRKTDWTQYAALDPGYLWQSTPITRGYTGHEQLDPVGLVHMNGRVYDPEIGRFLSADIVIQDVTNLQSLNAYSYVLNNPLSFTDPSGFFFKSLFRAIGNFFKSVFRAIGSVLKAVLKSSIVRAAIQIVACANPAAIYTCGAAAAGLALAAGGSVVDALKAGAFAFAQMYIWPAVHGLGDFLGTTGTLAHSFVQGAVGGALSVAQGGSFLQGFASNAIGDAAGLFSEGLFGKAGTGGDQGMFLRTAVAATAGGLAAEVTGGKFANGALTAAMAHLYNAEGLGDEIFGPPIPEAPPGVDLDANIMRARLSIDPRWFYNQVREGGPWDFKTVFNTSRYESYGNFHYGVVAAAFGFSEFIILNEAGIAQWNSHAQNRTGDWGWPADRSCYVSCGSTRAGVFIGGSAPYGDDPRDVYWIMRGIRYYRERYGKK